MSSVCSPDTLGIEPVHAVAKLILRVLEWETAAQAHTMQNFQDLLRLVNVALASTIMVGGSDKAAID